MLVEITLVGDKELMARFDAIPHAAVVALEVKVRSLALELEAWVKTRKLNGQVLNRISGALSRSINNKVVVAGTSVMGHVFSSGDVKYAAIHEFGGFIPAHIIIPKKAHALAFGGGFYAKVNHPGSHMPERSFLRSSLTDMSKEISLGMKTAVIEAIQKQVRR